MSGGTWLGESPQSSPSFNSWMKTKKFGSFLKAFLNYMVKRVFSAVLEFSAGTMHVILPSMMLKKTWT